MKCLTMKHQVIQYGKYEKKNTPVSIANTSKVLLK